MFIDNTNIGNNNNNNNIYLMFFIVDYQLLNYYL